LIEIPYLRRVGQWSTKTIEPQHWNEDLLRSVDNDLSPMFDEIHDEGCEHFASSIAESVNETVETLNNALKGKSHADTSRHYTDPFQSTLQHRSLVPL
jgi:hypothetical protein